MRSSRKHFYFNRRNEAYFFNSLHITLHRRTLLSKASGPMREARDKQNIINKER